MMCTASLSASSKPPLRHDASSLDTSSIFFAPPRVLSLCAPIDAAGRVLRRDLKQALLVQWFLGETLVVEFGRNLGQPQAELAVPASTR
jgi:hypothetical protein